jgi:alcohol dehydrogenase
MHAVIGLELSVHGSHGMAAAGYPRLLADIAAGLLDPAQLIARTITLGDTPGALMEMSTGTEPGITIIRP